MKTLLAEIHAGLADVLQSTLAEAYPEHYETIESIKLWYTPQVICAPKSPLERALMISLIVLFLGTAVILSIVYRKEIRIYYLRVVNSYREKRRHAVFEEYGIPYGMYFLPKERDDHSGITTFETPYGDIHLTRPLVEREQTILPGFIQIEENHSC